MPARSKLAEPTARQTEKEERQEQLRKARKRQARHMETISQLDGNNCSLDGILLTRRLPAYPAYDESPHKRRKLRHDPKKKKLARRAQCTKNKKQPRSKKPPPPSSSPLPSTSTSPSPTPSPSSSPSPRYLPSPAGTTLPDQRPTPCAAPRTVLDTSSRKLNELPAEILDEILRYRLLWPHDIVVFNGWERVYPRSRPRLDLSILYTCRTLRDQGLRILYGENQFEYNLRDPLRSHSHTNRVLDQVFGHSIMPINKYGHLIRYIKIKVHHRRLHLFEQRESFEKAILKFLPGGGLAHPANLHTITLEVPALCNKDLEPDPMMLDEEPTAQQPNEVPIYWYLRRGSRVGDALPKIRTQWVRVLAYDRYDKCWETKVDLRYFRKDEQMRLEYMARSEGKKPSTVDFGNNLGITSEPGADTSYRTKDVEAMEKLWSRQVEEGVAGLNNLAGRIERLAIDPDLVVDKLGVWRPVNTTNGRGPKISDTSGFVSLPSNWREASSRTNGRPRRARITAARTQLDKSPSPGIQSKKRPRNKVKSKAKPRTTGKTGCGDKSILNTGDTVKEAKLLEAQQAIQGKGTNRNMSGMLTEEWLESLPVGVTKDSEGSQCEEFEDYKELDTGTTEV
ncbi:hypothetical protein F5Y07DRAFT_393609 [Xylaria sp. FL0933]|nr:hypothetical protein F5Y07DRAFT_393609 [Xylaria sp. FL0933]